MNKIPIYFRFLGQFWAVLGTLEINHFHDSFFLVSHIKKYSFTKFLEVKTLISKEFWPKIPKNGHFRVFSFLPCVFKQS